MSEDTSTAVVLAAEDRRAVADALRIATRGKDRPALRSVIVSDGLAMVTDTYVAVNVPALAGLPAGAWSADALAVAVKGAGTDGVRIAPVDGDTLRVDRIAGAYARSRSPERIRQDYADGVPDGHRAGTYYVGRVDGAPGTIAGIYADAVAAVMAPDYVPELAGFGPERIADVLAARPSGRRPGQAAPVRILPRGLRAAVVTDGGQPYAVVMPMRDA
jgi:hypothetical protein